MVVNNFYFFRPTLRPAKTNAILIVHANTVLSGSIPFQQFQSVSRRNTKLFQYLDGIQLLQLPQSRAGCRSKRPVPSSFKEHLGSSVGEGLNHDKSVPRSTQRVERGTPASSYKST